MKASKVAIGLAFAVFFFYRMALWWAHPLRSWADQAVYLAMSQLLLMGKVPYLDFFDFNPPLIIYLNTVPWLLAGLLSWPITCAFILFIYLLAALSLWLCWLVFDRYKYTREYQYRWFMLFAMLAFTQSHQADFGQREHIFVLFFLPYVILRCFVYDNAGRGDEKGQQVGPGLALFIGLLAGLGVCIKPHFLEVIVAFELVWQLCRRNFRSLLNRECLAVYGTVVLYFAHFLLLPRAALDILLKEALPIYTNGVGGYASSIICGLTLDSAFFLPMYALVAVLLLSAAVVRRSNWVTPLSALVLVSFAIYLQAGTVWTYRMLPMQAFLDLLFGLDLGIVCFMLVESLPEKAPEVVKFFAPYLLLCVSCLYGYREANSYIEDIKGTDKFSLSALGYNGSNPENDLDAIFYTILKHTDKLDKVVLMGPAVLPGYPAILQSGRLPGCRYLHGMILPMLHYCREHDLGKKFDDLERQTVKNYGEDILKNKPRLVFISDEFIKPQIEHYEFIPTYLKDYDSLGTLHQVKYEVFKLKDGKFAAGVWTVERRRQLVLKILADSLSVDQAAAQNGLSKERLARWVKAADEALRAALTDNPGGGETELRAMVLESIEKAHRLELENAALRKENNDLKSR